MNALVVIGFAEALAAPEVAWSLKDAGHEVLVVGRRGRSSALRHSVHVQVTDITPPEVDLNTSIQELQAILVARSARRDTPAVILPLDDKALCLWSRLKLPPGWINMTAANAATDLALDKAVQIKYAEAAGFNVPITTIARTTKDVLRRVDELPLALRPANAVWTEDNRLQKGSNWVCATAAELQQALSIWAERWPLLVQPFIRGTGEGVFGLATETGIRALSAHRRLRMMNPHGSGSSACASQSVPGEVRKSVEVFVEATGWRGLFMIELLRDETGTRWFIELNGRPWGSMALSRRQGLDYPAWAAAVALDPTAPLGSAMPQAGEIICRNAGRELMHLLFVLRGPKSQAFERWPSFWRTAVALLPIRRRDTFYNWRRDDAKVFFSDCWYTLRDNLCKSRN